jgi:flagellin-specific chaperone FliS
MGMSDIENLDFIRTNKRTQIENETVIEIQRQAIEAQKINIKALETLIADLKETLDKEKEYSQTLEQIIYEFAVNGN